MLFMAAAELFASRSTCQRLKTAALIVRDQNIISIGYNGVVRGDTHCDAYWFALYQEKRVGHSYPSFYSFSKSDEFYQLHHPWSTAHEIHGEQNAILQAHTDLRGAAIYSLYAPCIHCAKAIVTAGLTHLYYRHVYTRDVSGLDFCISRGIACQQIGDPVAS
jgi:dCMP deaminase